jgi:hypothetical protein
MQQRFREIYEYFFGKLDLPILGEGLRRLVERQKLLVWVKRIN